MSSTRSTSFIAIVLASAAIVIAFIAVFIGVGNGGFDGVNNGGTTITFTNPPLYLSLRDTRVQTLNGANQWTDVRFNTNTFISTAWEHTTTTVNDARIIAERKGLYIVYFSIQAQARDTQLAQCKACNLRYWIRALQLSQDPDDVNAGELEVPGSLTYSNGHSLFLSKQFHINASVGDVFRFQFISKCATLELQPFADATPLNSDSRPVSATLLIF